MFKGLFNRFKRQGYQAVPEEVQPPPAAAGPSGPSGPSTGRFNWQTNLFEAAMQNRVSIFEHLLRQDRNRVLEVLSKPDADGFQVLMYAIAFQANQIVMMLLNYGVDPECICTSLRITPLLLAVRFKNYPIVLLLVQREINLNQGDIEGDTALMYAAASGYTEIVALLLANGAKVNLENERGYTALIWAILGGHPKIAKRLIQEGADREKVLANDIIFNRCSEEIVSLLVT